MRGMFGDPTRHILNGLVLCLFPGTFAVKSLADEKTPARESAADAASASDVIDGYMRAKWREKRLQPAPSADDRVFLLRIYAHLTGRHATMEEVERFVRSRDPDKHRRMIDSLLESEQYARHWAQVWRRALLLNRKPLREADIERFDQWLAGQLHRNQSASLIVRELLTAEGDLRSGGAAAFCYVNGSPQVMAEATGKFFLGLNLRCVACHDRPETKWRRKDFDGIAACFDHVRWVEDGERRAIVSGMRPVPEDRAAAREVAFQSVKVGGEDPREALADWVTSPDNPYFARHVVNRYWKELFARPLEKERQLTRREPGLHEELLSRLAADLVEHRYDLKHLIRTICNSQTYQLGTTDARKTDAPRLFCRADAPADAARTDVAQDSPRDGIGLHQTETTAGVAHGDVLFPTAERGHQVRAGAGFFALRAVAGFQFPAGQGDWGPQRAFGASAQIRQVARRNGRAALSDHARSVSHAGGDEAGR